MSNAAKADKIGVKDGRYVCPACKHRTTQAYHEATSAQNLLLWCKQCKAVHVVNIELGQCYVVSRYR